MTTIIEIQKRLQYLTNAKITQTDIADALEVGRSNISQRIKNKSELSFDELKKIENKFNISLSEQKINKGFDDVDGFYFPDVLGSCGNGVFEMSQECYPIKIPRNDFFKEISPFKKYSVINAYGESMNPIIKDGDKLIIEHLENNEPIQDGKIYVFCYNDQISVKRLIYNVDEIIVKSDNPDKEIYKTKFIKQEEINKLYIIGQIVGLTRNLR